MTFNFTANIGQAKKKVIYQQFFLWIGELCKLLKLYFFSSVESILIMQQLSFLIKIYP